jgi:hypothetical protein
MKQKAMTQKPSIKSRIPSVEVLGSLNTIVRQTGNNDSDGNRWRPVVDDTKSPPIKNQPDLI